MEVKIRILQPSLIRKLELRGHSALVSRLAKKGFRVVSFGKMREELMTKLKIPKRRFKTKMKIPEKRFKISLKIPKRFKTTLRLKKRKSTEMAT